MLPIGAALLIHILVPRPVAVPAQDSPSTTRCARETLSLDSGWWFHEGDIPHRDFRPNGDEAEGGSKGASAWGAAAPSFDHRSWTKFDLPHDWVLEQPFIESAVRSQGYRPRGIAWYRRQFRLPESDRSKRLELQFDGVSTHCTVWFNGSVVYRSWNGYRSFSIDITPLARFGDDTNTIAVRDDAQAMEGWWYEGGGIYRHTWLVKRPPMHIVGDGVDARPVKAADGRWSVPVETTLINDSGSDAEALIEATLHGPDGKRVTSAKVRRKVIPGRR
ncbi:MAG: hypothetical protein KIS66_12560 [Fimbriimonadaceae bacterium]|nr:hypothetical protein [Fimbriimonadaceae bacterium]